MVSKNNEQYILEFIPKDLEYLTKQSKIFYNGVNLKCSYLTNIVHDLISKYYFSFNVDIKFNLSSVLLRKKYGENYNKYIDYLIDQGVIILVSNYLVGTKARTYKIDVKYVDDDLIRFKCKDTFLLKKSKNRYSSITNIYTNTIPTNIKERLINDLYKIKIDHENALKHITKYDDVKFKKNKFTINNIKNGDIFFSFDSFGRFHNNFTTLKKEIRNNYLTINNEVLAEVDIKNSQPFFLSVLLKKELLQINNDTRKFIDLTINGLIYEYIIENSNLESRDKAKDMMYIVLFGDNKKNANRIHNNYNKIFKKLFPSVAEYLWEFKNSRTYKEMSHELQRMESNFIFNTVIEEIYQKYPNIVLFTVHDSIIFPKSYLNEVEEIFYKHFNILKNSLIDN